jgi:hypothetical protein
MVQYPEKIIQKISLYNMLEFFPLEWNPCKEYVTYEFFNIQEIRCWQNHVWKCFEARRKDGWKVDIAQKGHQWKFKVSQIVSN